MAAEQISPPRAAIAQLFDDAPVVFSVGTIEERKNHLWLLSAFERHWQRGAGTRLVLAGRAGWNSEPIVQRITHHAAFGSRLFWFHDASDDEIRFLYQNACATAYVSVAEGFGLPIIESLHHGTPVLASDTAIHREVGRQQVLYCSLTDLDDVTAKLEQIVSGAPPRQARTDQLLVPSWQECTDQLLGHVLAQARQRADQRSAPRAGRAA